VGGGYFHRRKEPDDSGYRFQVPDVIDQVFNEANKRMGF
jgi:hypothetical protein